MSACTAPSATLPPRTNSTAATSISKMIAIENSPRQGSDANSATAQHGQCQPIITARPAIDFAAVRSALNIADVLDLLGFLTPHPPRAQLRGPCPLHGSTHATSRCFSVNVEQQNFQCFKCGRHGNALDLWTHAAGQTPYDAAVDVCQRLNLPVPTLPPNAAPASASASKTTTPPHEVPQPQTRHREEGTCSSPSQHPYNGVTPDRTSLFPVSNSQRAIFHFWVEPAHALAFEGLVPAFDLAVALRIIGRGADVGHAGDAHKFLEILGDELRPVVGDDARGLVGKGFAAALDDDFDVGFFHLRTDVPVYDKAAVAVEDGEEKIKGASYIYEADIDMPLLMRAERLDIAGALLGGFGGLAGEQTGGLEDAIGAGGGAGDDVGIKHHEGHAAISFERVLAGESLDAFFFVLGEPMVARDPGVVFVDFAEAVLPVVEFAGLDAEPALEARRRDVGLVAPGADEIDDGVACVVGDPLAGQGSPSSFFKGYALP